MESALERGVPPERVAFVAFSRIAANEAKQRAMARFNLIEEELPNFRTLHSLCFRELSLRRDEVVSNVHLQELGELTGELIKEHDDPTMPASGLGADPLLTVEGYARTTLRTLHDAWHDHGEELDWFRFKRFCDAYALYKHGQGLSDFTDMLARYSTEGFLVDVDVAIIDEAQDLTPLQWRVVERAFSTAKELWVAGDDDQAVHKWAGADEDHFLSLGYAQEVLPILHRLPRSIYNLSQEISARIERRYPKDHRPRDAEGSVNWVASPEEVDLSSDTWLMLARTRTQLTELMAEARSQGVVYVWKGVSSVNPDHVRAIQGYETSRGGRSIDIWTAGLTLAAAGLAFKPEEDRDYTPADMASYGLRLDIIWHDALTSISLEDREYYLACLRRGEKLTSAPRVRIDTIHGAKGTEAKNVLLMTDLNYRVQKGVELDPDAEHRVYYVGATRASENLYICEPRGVFGYRL